MLWNGIIMILSITISGITQRPLWIKAIKKSDDQPETRLVED